MESTPYTFDSFVISERSRLAVATALDVVRNPKRAPNPLFLCGPTGSGKSHLLHAIEHALRSRHPRASILRISAQALIDLLIAAIRSDEVRAWRQSLAELDALLVDDFRFGAHQQYTQEAILVTLEELVSSGVQIVAASDAGPANRALMVQVGYPDADARVQIARNAALRHGVALSDNALRSLSKRIAGSPRRLQSAIVRMAAEAILSGPLA